MLQNAGVLQQKNWLHRPGTCPGRRDSQPCWFYYVFLKICVKKWSFGLMFWWKVVTLLSVFEGHVTECTCFTIENGALKMDAKIQHWFFFVFIDILKKKVVIWGEVFTQSSIKSCVFEGRFSECTCFSVENGVRHHGRQMTANRNWGFFSWAKGKNSLKHVQMRREGGEGEGRKRRDSRHRHRHQMTANRNKCFFSSTLRLGKNPLCWKHIWGIMVGPPNTTTLCLA